MGLVNVAVAGAPADAAQYEEETTDFTLGDDRVIEFRPTKMARVMTALMRLRHAPSKENGGAFLDYVAAQLDWIKAGVSEEDWEHLQTRLDDPDDALEIADLRNAYEALQSWATARPTMSRSDSSAPPRHLTDEDEQKTSESTSGASAPDGSAT